MRKTAIVFFLLTVMVGMEPGGIAAVRNAKITTTLTPTEIIVPTPTIMPAVKENITEPSSQDISYRLESVLDGQRVGAWNGINTMRIVVRMAVARGVSANTIVLILLLPLVATTVGLLHYVIGLSGYGIFMPTMVAVSFLATGIPGGLALFAMILIVSLLAGVGLKRFRLHFWPARSINLLFISLGTFGLMLVSSYFSLLNITNISIFPVLLMIMLAEDFVRTQLAKSKKEAQKLMVGTIVLSMVGAIGMSIRQLQELVLLNPEVVIILVLVINWWVGNYGGIRLTEIERFRKAIRETKREKILKSRHDGQAKV